MNQSIGAWIDQQVDFQEKAAYFAIKTTRAYLDANLDEAAKLILQEFGRHTSIVSFYKEFFAKHAVVYGCSELVAFDCINPSACTITLVRKLREA